MDFDQWIVRRISIFSFHFSRLFPIRSCPFHSNFINATDRSPCCFYFIYSQAIDVHVYSISSVELVYIVYVLQSIQINVFLRLILFECLFVGHTNHEKKNHKRTEKKKKKQKRTKKCKKRITETENPCDKSEWYYFTNGKHNPTHLDLQ